VSRCPFCGAEISELVVDVCRCHTITYSYCLDDKGRIEREEIDREEPDTLLECACCPECGEDLRFDDEDEIEAFLRGEIILAHRDDVELHGSFVIYEGRRYKILHEVDGILYYLDAGWLE